MTEPLQLNPQDVVNELEAMPEARPYWALAQERAARKAVQQQLTEQNSELEKLRQDLARRDRDDRADEKEPAEHGPAAPGVVTREV